MDKSPSPVVVINATELQLNQSPLSNYGIDKLYPKSQSYRVRCVNCEKSESEPRSFKTCSRCLTIGVKRWEPIFHFYCSRECQTIHWEKHRIEHQLYEARQRESSTDQSRVTNSQKTVVQSTKALKGTQCNMQENSISMNGRVVYPTEDHWFPLVPHSSAPSRKINQTKKMKDAATDTSDAPKKSKKKPKKKSSILQKDGTNEDYSSLSSENIAVVNVNEYPPLDKYYTYCSDDSSSGSDAGGSNMYIYMDGDGKKSAVLKKRKKKIKKNFNPRVLFERERRVRQRKPPSVAPKIRELTADEVDSLAAKCNPKYHANLKKDTSRSRAPQVGETKKMKHDTLAQKDKTVEGNAKKTAPTESSTSGNSSTPGVSTVQKPFNGSQKSQSSVSDSSSVGKSKAPENNKKPYTDEILLVTKSATKSLYTGSSTQEAGVMSPWQRDGGAVVSEITPPLDNPKSMELLKTKLDEIVIRKFRFQPRTQPGKLEIIMLQVVDQCLDLTPAAKDSEKPRRSRVALKSTPKEGDGVLSPLSDDDYHDACTDLRNDDKSRQSPLVSTENNKSEKAKMKPHRNKNKDKTHIDSGDPAGAETEEERIQRILTHINRTTYEKVKEPGDPDDLEAFCKSRAEARATKDTVKSQKSTAKIKRHQEQPARPSEDNKSQESAMKPFAGDDRGKSENLVYVVAPYIHSKYPRRVDQYNGADPNDPFVEYSSSQSFVVQKPSRQRDVSYIGLLLSEKPNTVITQRYILLKNAAYDGRDIELGIKREVIDINEAGEPLYDDYLIRKINMKKDSEATSKECISQEKVGKSAGDNNASNIVSQLASPTNLTTPISSNRDSYQDDFDFCEKEANSVTTATPTLADEATAKNVAGDRPKSLLEHDRNVDEGVKCRDLPVVEDSFASKDNSTNVEFEGTGRFRVRNSSKEFGDIFSAEAEEQIANAPALDLARVFAGRCDETGADDTRSTDNASHSCNGDLKVNYPCVSPTDMADDPFLIRTADFDSFPYQFRKEQGCIFIIKQWEDYYY